ncbi:MAG: hypothetical protein EZS28_023064 [Streblomastix strix]|uniref:Uncharacterized protein n=1 Tax=Streblomastix strix TaxID=222440 RepID=A0A5J4VFN9_9EUKA|nr:MAG: hypothetical protein EZS28_023064 [Streblomastix strix]
MDTINEQNNNDSKTQGSEINAANDKITPKRKYERNEGAKCGRTKKYNTIEDAQNNAREQRSVIKKRQYALASKNYWSLITYLKLCCKLSSYAYQFVSLSITYRPLIAQQAKSVSSSKK